MLVPTDEEAGTGQLVGLVWVAEQWLAAAAAAHFSVCLAFLIVLVCFLLPNPNHRAAAVENLRTAAAGIGIGGVDFLQVNCAEFVCSLLVRPGHTCSSVVGI